MSDAEFKQALTAALGADVNGIERINDLVVEFQGGRRVGMTWEYASRLGPQKTAEEFRSMLAGCPQMPTH